MKKTTIYTGLLIASFYATNTLAAPSWTHEDQHEWGATEDPSQATVPLMYPFADCSIGKRQSPVDLAGADFDKNINRLQIRYPADTPDFYNTGHAAQVNTTLDYDGFIKIGKERYPMVQFHFHAPSEHTIGSQAFAAELHFVHVRDDGKLAVLGILIEEGEENETLQTVLDNMPLTEKTHNPDTGIHIHPAKLLPRNTRQSYTYAGSLTTPPCSEGISWYVLAEPLTASADQIAQLNNLYSGNVRFTQELNGRAVQNNIR